MSDPRDVLLSMEGLASHMIRELLEVRRQQRAEAQQRAAQAEAAEKKRIKQESKAKVKAEAKIKAEAKGIKAEPGDDEAAASSAAAASAASAAPAPKAAARPRHRRSTAKRTIIIEYQPAEKNCYRDERGELHISGGSSSGSSTQGSSQASSQWSSSIKREQSDGGASSAAAAAFPSAAVSRWCATPAVKLSGRKKKGSNAGSKPKRARSATDSQFDDSSSQQSIPASQDDEALSQRSFGEGSQEAERDEEEPEEEDHEREGAGGVRARSRQIIYPSRNGHRQLASLVTHMAATYLQIQSGSHANIRELWYDYKALFRSKSYSDNSLKLLCSVLSVPRHALQLVGTAKGLVAGDLQFELEDFAEDAVGNGSPAAPLGFQLCDCSGGHPIPPHVHQIRGMSCGASWLLLVEKDTVYSKLMQAGFPQLQGCLLVTGKGMPDFATCNFLHLLSTRFPSLPLFGLFDCDPDGIGIFAEYKYGNVKTAQHKNALPRLQLLGLTIADAIKAGVFHTAKLPLTNRDQARIRNMLGSEIGQKDAVIRAELLSMSELSHKAEIECLSQAGPDYLAGTFLLEKKAQLEAAARVRAQAETVDAAANGQFPADPSSSSISSTGVSSVKSEWSDQPFSELSSAHSTQSLFGSSFDSDLDDGDPFAEDADIQFDPAPEIGSIGSTLNDDSPWLL